MRVRVHIERKSKLLDPATAHVQVETSKNSKVHHDSSSIKEEENSFLWGWGGLNYSVLNVVGETKDFAACLMSHWRCV